MSVKTILVAHHSTEVRNRFAAALMDARQEYLLASSEPLLRAALAEGRPPVNLALVDLALARSVDPVSMISDLRRTATRGMPLVIFAGSVTSADQIAALAGQGVAGYLNEHADARHILPALAPHLFPDNFNRRSGARVDVAIPVSYRAGQTIAAAQTRDISRGGVGIQTLEPLETGTPVQLSFKLPGMPQEISASARVVWRDQRKGMGVQFDKLFPEAQQILEAFVEKK
jgi:uncharacterized protein (TIGR02266 family)